MKFKQINTCIFCSLFIFSCTSTKSKYTSQNVDDARLHNFLTGQVEGTTYTTLEIDSMIDVGGTIQYQNMSRVFKLVATTSDTEELYNGTIMLKEEIINDQPKGKLNPIQKIEIQHLIHMVINSKLDLTEIDKDKKFATLLKIIINYTDPIEWRPLTKAYILAQTALSVEERNRIRTYLVQGMNKTINEGIVKNQDNIERLKKDAQEALPIVMDL